MHPTEPKMINAYGDREGDGMVQMSFVLPLRMLRLVPAPVVFHDHYGTIEVDTAIGPTPEGVR